MSFGVENRVLWDFWTLEQSGETWLYALSAPRTDNPETRHDTARIDVATSRDLVNWTWRGIAMEAGHPGAWDDLALWTGSVAPRLHGGYAMLYTGRARAEGGKVQRIGLALSEDLLHWTKHPDPVIEVAPALYRIQGRNGSTNWRDPWLEWDEQAGIWRAWITAQHPDGPIARCGTVALAESPDLVRWTVHPPVVHDRLTEHLEVPQRIDDGGAMLVSCYAHHVPQGDRLPQRCMSLLYRRRQDGSYGFARIVEDWPTDSRYILKEVRDGVGLCWMGRTGEGSFLGRISDPFPFRPNVLP
jgi:beta-fructofuranosidase